MQEELASTLLLYGRFSPVNSNSKYDYTATIELQVSPDAPKGFAEFFWQVVEVSEANSSSSRHNRNDIPCWEDIAYDDIYSLISLYPGYFSYRILRSSIDQDQVRLNEIFSDMRNDVL